MISPVKHKSDPTKTGGRVVRVITPQVVDVRWPDGRLTAEILDNLRR